MRAISPYSNYTIQLIEANTKRGIDSHGNVVEYSDSKPVLAHFHVGGLTKWEELEALESFPFGALSEGVNPLTTVSFFDSEAYCMRYPENERAKMQDVIDRRLVELAQQNPNEFRVIEKPAAPKPWPSYDEDSVEEVLQFQARQGFSPTDVRLYEIENKNRKTIIAAMEELEAEAALAVDERISVAR